MINVLLIPQENDVLIPQENDEDIFGPKVPYLSVIIAPMYVANYIWRDIAFVINLLSNI